MIQFSVWGIPVTQGSARAINAKHSGRAILIPDHRVELRSWREAIASAAAQATEEPLRGAVSLGLLFALPAPKSRPEELRTPRQVAEWAYPWRRPDLDKLARAVLDALTGVLFLDDAQVVELRLLKVYGNRAGLTVTATMIAPGPAGLARLTRESVTA